ncbi:MAG TPA: hypothetical protein VGR35_10245 [Tepidisphaeraceae bacterium]|nr:hypothetical protein [Tepidisphaeraceae bacterium]
MTQREVEFCRDVQGFLEFALRNGLSFPLVVSTLSHDINNIVRQGMTLEAPEEDAFMPKVAGYADETADSVGETAEVEKGPAAA